MDFKVPDVLQSSNYEMHHFPVCISNLATGFKFPATHISSVARDILSGICVGHILDSVIVTNYTQKAISVIDRFNRVRTINPTYNLHSEQSGFEGCVVVEKIIGRNHYVGGDQDVNYRKYISMEALKQKDNVRGFYEIDDPYDLTEQYHYFEQTIIRDIDKSLNQHSGAFYIGVTDLVFVSTDPTNVTFLHPLTDSYTKMTLCPSYGSESTTGVELFINDREHTMTRAFTNMGGVVLEVPIQRNPSLRNGIYVSTTTIDEFRKVNRSTKYYNFTDTDSPVRVFDSRNDAESKGSNDAILEKQILDLKQEIARAKEELELKKQETARISLEVTKLATEDRKEEFATKTSERERSEAASKFALKQTEMEAEYKAKQAKMDAKFKAEQIELAKARSRLEEERTQKIETSSFFRKAIVETIKVVAAVASVVGTIFAWSRLKG